MHRASMQYFFFLTLPETIGVALFLLCKGLQLLMTLIMLSSNSGHHEVCLAPGGMS